MTKRLLQFSIAFSLLLFANSPVKAQLSVADTLSTIQLLQGLFGAGVSISNVTFPCADTTAQIGEFDATVSNLGLGAGMIISTGDFNDAVGPNNSTSTGMGVGPTFGDGDADLDALLANPFLTTEDACGVEFDIVPLCDTISIRYVFGSEEYPEFVNASFNDIFAFFISGPLFPTPQNIALIPGTTTPVSIDNVNNLTNSAFYVDNTGGGSVQYDGFTVPLEATARVVPCQSYHIKIVIADAGDDIYDSAVFLENGGIQCTGNLLNLNVTNNLNLGGNVNNITVEGCADGTFLFERSGSLMLADTFYFDVLGTATPGVDYAPIADSIIFPVGVDSAAIPVNIFPDGLVENSESILLVYTDSSLCGGQIYTDTIEMVILDEPIQDAGPDVAFCSGESASIGIMPTVLTSYDWTPTTGLSDPSSANSSISLTNNTSSTQIFTYYLTSTDVIGCTATDSIQVTVYPEIVADFEADTVCAGQPTSFTDLSGPNTTTWTWDYGDGTLGPLQNPAHVYPASGTFTTELVVMNPQGCRDTVTGDILVYENPSADFLADSACFGEPTSFLDQSTNALSWQWDLGDGTSLTIQNATHTYGSPGSYDVQLIVTDANGCSDSVTQMVDIFRLPQPDFIAEGTCVTDGLKFTQTTSPGDTNVIPSFFWEFGDGNTSSVVDPFHTYNAFGTYDVTLTVVDAYGCTNLVTQSVDAYPPVEADFDFSRVCFGQNTSFTDLSTSSSASPVSEWFWQFGDQNSSNVQNPGHQYGEHGFFDVELIAVNTDGCRDTIVKSVEVYDQPIARFNYDLVCEDEGVSFSNTSIFNNPNLTYSWDFADGTGNTSTDENPVYTFPAAGLYPVEIAIVNDNGCQDQATANVQVYSLPEIDFSFQDHCKGEASIFTNASTVASPSMMSSYLWEFEDGRTKTDANPTIYFQDAGPQIIKLTGTSNHGCSSEHIDTLTTFPLPTANFAKRDVCFRDTVEFTDYSWVNGGNIAGWEWSFGDGSSSNIPNPEHSYAAPGFYNTALIAYTDKGCSDRLNKTVEIYKIPNIPNIINDTICAGGDAVLVAQPQNDESVEWFYDSEGGSPFHIGNTYVSADILFDQVFYVENVSPTGCRSGRAPIYTQIFSPENVALFLNDTELEIPNATLSPQVATTIDIDAYQWNFGDGTVLYDSLPSHEYTSPGIYKLEVLLTNENGCNVELEELIEVREVLGMHIPSAFTPNGDGINDEFYIGAALIANFSFEVFNRWGQLVYEANSPDFRWNGVSLKGSPLPEGVYAYKLKAYDMQGREIIESGTITLLR